MWVLVVQGLLAVQRQSAKHRRQVVHFMVPPCPTLGVSPRVVPLGQGRQGQGQITEQEDTREEDRLHILRTVVPRYLHPDQVQVFTPRVT